MTEMIRGFERADVVFADGRSLADVKVAIYPGWIRLQTESAEQFHPREQVERVRSSR